MHLLPRPEDEPLLSFYTAGELLVRPPLELLTIRDWRGGEKLGRPGDGLVLAGNHISWLDPLLFLHFANDHGRALRFLAKAELWDLPVGGWFMRGTRQIPVHRGSADAATALAAAETALRAGECLMVYPEGTITRDPDLWPMRGKSGAARLALATGKPLVPAAMWGAQEIMPPYQLKLALWPRKTVRVLVGDPLDLSDLAGAPVSTAVPAATERLLRAITDLVAQLRGESAPTGRWDPRTGRREPLL